MHSFSATVALYFFQNVLVKVIWLSDRENLKIIKTWLKSHVCVDSMNCIFCMLISFFNSSGDWTMQGSIRRLAQYPLGVVWSCHVRAALLGPSPHLLFPSARTLFSETGVWEKVYQSETRRRVEEWWHPRIMARWRESVEEVRGSFTHHRYFWFESRLNLESWNDKNQNPRTKILTYICMHFKPVS